MNTSTNEAIAAAEKEIENRDVESTRGMLVQSAIDKATEHLRQQILNRESRWEEAERMLALKP